MKDYPNIIWLMIDSLRNEFLNEFGSPFERTFLDDLISKGTSFTNCYSAAPFTIVSTASIITGSYPSVNGLDGWLKKDPMKKLNFNCITVFDMLKFYGYTNTYMYSSTSCPYIPAESFDKYIMQNGSENFPIEEYINTKGPKSIILGIDVIHDDCCLNNGSYTSDLFHKSIVKVSALIENYYNRIKSDNDIIIITSDHGVRVIDELINTKYSDEFVTGRFLTDKTIKNSFTIIWPEKIKVQKIHSMVRSVDIFPTIMDLLGKEIPKLDGISLLDIINNPESNKLPEFSFSLSGWSLSDPINPGIWSARDNKYKLVVNKYRVGLFKIEYLSELYDMENDCNESKNIIDEYPDIASKLMSELKNTLLKKRNPIELYDSNGFDFKKFISFKKKNINKQNVKNARKIIRTNWKNVRKIFLIGHYKYEIKRLFKYYRSLFIN